MPSEIAYDNATHGIKRDSDGEPVTGSGNKVRTFHWGFEIGPLEPRMRYLKLRLDDGQEYPPSVSRGTVDAQLTESGVTVEEAVSDFISALFRHAKEEMIERFGETMVSTTPIRVILTVPAVWSDAAKDATLRAAEKAGMGTNIRMISEPEAAANYAINAINSDRKILNASDSFIVLDGGGGTVDLISYKIVSLDPLRLQEAAPGIGALCGAAFLNLRFEDLIRTRLGAAAFDRLRESLPMLWPAAVKEFENSVKRNFDPSKSKTKYDKKKYFITFPGAPNDPEAGIKDGYITIHSAEVAEIFRPIIDSVIDLVERQRMTLAANGLTAKGVILVGGFGQSKYLHACLKQRFADQDPLPTYSQATAGTPPGSEGPRFQILQPPNPWTAVVRGAVLSGLETGVIVSRKARRHYGVITNRTWDRSKHSPNNKYWCETMGEWRADNQIDWCIQRGQDLPVDKPVMLPFSYVWTFQKRFPSSVNPKIIVSDAVDAPSEYVKSAETRVLCQLPANLKDVPRDCFGFCIKNERKLRELEIEVGVVVDSGSLNFDLRVDDIVYGKVRADYE